MVDQIAPRVTVYDPAFKPVGRVASAARISRSYVLDEPGRLDFLVDADDRMLTLMNPLDGRVAVVESDDYPYPWVGKITALRRDRTSGSVQVSGIGFERVFEQRYTSSDVSIAGGAGLAVERTLASINATNPTGIEAGEISDSRRDASTTLSYANGREAFDAFADLDDAEWWVEPVVRSIGITLRLNFRQARGFDRFREVSLVDPGNCAWESWDIDGEALTYGLTMLGGEASAGQSIADRASGSADVSDVDLTGPHGYLPFGPVGAANLLTRQDRFAVAQQLRATGQLQAATEAMLSRQRVGGVPQSVRLSVRLNATTWPLLDVGTVVHLVLPSAMTDGFDGPARILGAQPMEEDGDMQLTVQLLRPKA